MSDYIGFDYDQVEHYERLYPDMYVNEPDEIDIPEEDCE